MINAARVCTFAEPAIRIVKIYYQASLQPGRHGIIWDMSGNYADNNNGILATAKAG
jgi:hypothetical protein